MRIVGGTWRGRTLVAPEGRGLTRPTTDRTRESIASMILSQRGLDLTGNSILDAFAGSGAIGFELISRGADRATFVDTSHAALSCIRTNAKSLGASEDEVRIIRGDISQLVATSIGGSPFDVVILDPPYAMPASVVTDVVAKLMATKQMNAEAIIVYERAATAPSIDITGIDGIQLLRTKRHGMTACDLMRV